MDADSKKILRALSLELRHILEGTYDAGGKWHPGDLDRRLNEIGIWRDRDKPLDELPHLSTEDKAARKVVAAYLKLRDEAGVQRSEAVTEFIRESAYTWANRLFALRCMEARNIIDEVILQKEAYGGRSLVHNRFAKKKPEACGGQDDGLFGVLFEEFSERSSELPGLFNPNSPAVALRPSVAALKKCIALLSGRENVKGQDAATDTVFESHDAFGWAYQYWNTEEKSRVFEKVRTEKGTKIEGADIIPATQLYTEPYMVKFLVQNSLGVLWVEMHPETKLSEHWEYFVRDADRRPADKKSVGEITMFDPAIGSGHFHLESFDLFYAMYEEEGVLAAPEAIAASILNNNLFGIDIDERAIQIATAALWMKAKQKAPKLQSTDLTTFHDHLVATNIRLPKSKDHLETFLMKHPDDAPLRAALETVFDGLQNAHEIGSLLQIEEPVEKQLRELKKHAEENKGKSYQEDFLQKVTIQRELPVGVESYEQWKSGTLLRLKEHFHAEALAADLPTAFFGQSVRKGLIMLDVLGLRYDVVTANPPYMNTRSHGKTLFNYFGAYYPHFCEDLYAVFIAVGCTFLKRGGKIGFVSQQSFFFTGAFKEGLRDFRNTIGLTTAARLGAGGFDEITGEVVNTILFVGRREDHADFEGFYFNLFEDNNKAERLLEKIRTGDSYKRQWSWFDCIPCSPLAFWLPEDVKLLYSEYPLLGQRVTVKQGLATTDNPRFVRAFWETTMCPSTRWFPFMMSEGGERWYGEYPSVLEWQFDGVRLKSLIREQHGSETKRIYSQGFYFRSGLTFGRYTGADLAVRYMPEGYIFDNSAPCAFSECDPFALAAYLNSSLAIAIAGALNPTSSLQVGDFSRLPMVLQDNYQELLECGRYAVTTASECQFLNLTSADCHGYLESVSVSRSLQHLHDRLICDQGERMTKLKLVEERIELWLRDNLHLSADWQALVKNRTMSITATRTIKQTAEDVFTETVLRLLGHRWPRQIKASEPTPDWADNDGVIPISGGTDEKTLLERIKERITDEFPGGNSQTIENEFSVIMGETLAKWLSDSFFHRNISQFRKRPIAWQVESRSVRNNDERARKKAARANDAPVFSCLVYYHKLNADLLPKIRAQYVGTLITKCQTEQRTLERMVLKTDEQDARKWELQNRIDELKTFDNSLNQTATNGFVTRSLRQYAIDDSMLQLKSRWLKKLRESCQQQQLKSWQELAKTSDVHADFPTWVADSIEHLPHNCASVGPQSPEENKLRDDPTAKDLAAIICVQPAKAVREALTLACEEWWKRFADVVLDPLKRRVKDTRAKQDCLEGELEQADSPLTQLQQATLKNEIKTLKAKLKELKKLIEVFEEATDKVRKQIIGWKCVDADNWESWLAKQPLYDQVSALSGKKPVPGNVADWIAQESLYAPDINDGVRVNIAPIQKAGLLAANVLAGKDIEKAIADRAEWRSDERRWVREGKLPQPGWW